MNAYGNSVYSEPEYIFPLLLRIFQQAAGWRAIGVGCEEETRSIRKQKPGALTASSRLVNCSERRTNRSSNSGRSWCF